MAVGVEVDVRGVHGLCFPGFSATFRMPEIEVGEPEVLCLFHAQKKAEGLCLER